MFIKTFLNYQILALQFFLKSLQADGDMWSVSLVYIGEQVLIAYYWDF